MPTRKNFAIRITSRQLVKINFRYLLGENVPLPPFPFTTPRGIISRVIRSYCELLFLNDDADQVAQVVRFGISLNQ